MWFTMAWLARGYNNTHCLAPTSNISRTATVPDQHRWSTQHHSTTTAETLTALGISVQCALQEKQTVFTNLCWTYSSTRYV